MAGRRVGGNGMHGQKAKGAEECGIWNQTCIHIQESLCIWQVISYNILNFFSKMGLLLSMLQDG